MRHHGRAATRAGAGLTPWRAAFVAWAAFVAFVAFVALVAWVAPPALAAGAGLHPTGTAPAAAPAGLLDFSPTELRQIQRHGPWPPPPALDPGNALAGQPAAIALGRRLFFDPRLSPDGRLACASCHVPRQAFTDGRARAQGRAPLARNTPTLWNVAHQRWYGWDGAFDSLWSQALHPLLDARELAANPAQVHALVQGDPALACLVRQLAIATPARRTPAAPATLPATSPASAEPAASTETEADFQAHATTVQLAKALGAFVGTLVSGPTPFDAFRDALASGNTRAAARYPLAAQRGLRLFVGRGQCSTCHVGPLFSNGEFGDIGASFFVRPGAVDAGRHAGITALLASPYNLLGPWADASGPDPDDPARKTRHVVQQHRNFGEFKVPGLRNVAHTAPYLHDGQLATLGDVVNHYSALNLDRLHADGEQILKPLNLADGERADLLAFLRSLSDPRARRWLPPAGPRCAERPAAQGPLR